MELSSRPPAPVLWATIGAVALAGAGAWAWDRASTSTEVASAEAVEAFRAAETAGGAVAPGIPAAGVYTYTAAGSEAGRLGPVSINREVPGRVQYLVTRTADGYTAETRVSAEHTEAMRYVVAGGWVRAAWRRVDVTFLGMGRDDRRDLMPPIPVVPVKPRVGQTWRLDYSVGSLRTSGTGRVVRAERVPVGGAAVDTLLVETRTHTSGTHGGPRVERVWWAPGLGLPVRAQTETHIGGTVGYDSEIRMELSSATPAT